MKLPHFDIFLANFSYTLSIKKMINKFIEPHVMLEKTLAKGLKPSVKKSKWCKVNLTNIMIECKNIAMIANRVNIKKPINRRKKAMYLGKYGSILCVKWLWNILVALEA